jgi:hypothetical protein
MENMGYRRQQQAQSGSNDPFWMLYCACVAVALALAGLPWIVLGFLAQRYLQRWLHWKLSFLFWVVLLFLSAFALYSNYQHGMAILWQREMADYILAAKHYQYDLTRWPLRQLWAETWPVWLRSWPGLGIAGFVGELVSDRSDTVRTLRQQELQRQRRAQRLQRRARRRTSRPTHVPDEIGGMMVIGVAINDDNEEA